MARVALEAPISFDEELTTFPEALFVDDVQYTFYTCSKIIDGSRRLTYITGQGLRTGIIQIRHFPNYVHDIGDNMLEIVLSHADQSYAMHKTVSLHDLNNISRQILSTLYQQAKEATDANRCQEHQQRALRDIRVECQDQEDR